MSIYDGTWASGEPPLEFTHFELMSEMKWSWDDLRTTPPYVVQYCTDLLNLRRQAEADAQEKANNAQQGGRHG